MGVYIADETGDTAHRPDQRWFFDLYPGSRGTAPAILLCDGCFQAATGLLAECDDGCPQDVGHTGLCLRASPDECQWCGAPAGSAKSAAPTSGTFVADQGLKPNTILQIHRIVSRALKVAWKRGKVSRNVAAMVDAPTGEEVDVEPLTLDEARRILAAAACRRNGARWSVALAVGIRQSEAIGLRWKYVNFDAGTVEVGWQIKRARFQHGCADPAACATGRHRVPCPPNCPTHRHRPTCPHGCAKRGHTCPAVKRPCPKDCAGHARECPQRTGGGWHFTRRKGVKPGQGSAKLVLALPGQLVAQLRAHRREQNAERLAAGAAWQDWDLVFCSPAGAPLDPHDDWEDWHDLLNAAGVRQARVHDARHTAATLLLSQGIDIRVVQQILGHSQLSQTQRYTHVGRELTVHAAERMGQALWG